MTFMIFSMGFVNQKFSTAAVVDKTLKGFKLENDMIKCVPRKTGPRWNLSIQLGAETSLGDLHSNGARGDEVGQPMGQSSSTFLLCQVGLTGLNDFDWGGGG